MTVNTTDYLISISNMLRHTFSESWLITIEPTMGRLLFRNTHDKRKLNILIMAYDEQTKIWYINERSTYCVGQAIHMLNTAVQVAEISMNIYCQGR